MSRCLGLILFLGLTLAPTESLDSPWGKVTDDGSLSTPWGKVNGDGSVQTIWDGKYGSSSSSNSNLWDSINSDTKQDKKYWTKFWGKMLNKYKKGDDFNKDEREGIYHFFTAIAKGGMNFIPEDDNGGSKGSNRKGCNQWGCFSDGGGCTRFGCFSSGGGCSINGCW